jgi:hypothetical protein
MANKRISQLPYVGNANYTPLDIMPIVNYDVPSGTTKHTPLVDLTTYILSGVTDDIITGGTYSGGTLVLSSPSGTINVTGFTTGSTQLYEVGSGTDSTQRIGVSADASGNKSVVSGGRGNSSSGGYSAIVGGKGNSTTKDFTFVGGGLQNCALGGYSFAGGGSQVVSGGGYSFAGGGESNISGGDYSVVNGGINNTSSCYCDFIGGGSNNTTFSSYSGVYGANTIVGGMRNTISSYYGCSVIVGGSNNNNLCDYSFIGGGLKNTNSNYKSVIVGGENNTTSGYGDFIGGGVSNTTDSTYSGYNFIGSGVCNKILSCTGYSFIGGGVCNNSLRDFSFIGGGVCNTTIQNLSTISGGYCNTASGENSTITGGRENISNCCYSFIGGGSGNTINHDFSSAVGKDVTSVSACTFHVNYLALQNTPETDVQTYTQYLTRDSATGVVKTKLNPGPTVYGLYAQTADSTIVSSATTPTTLIGPGIGTLSVPASGFTIGDSFRVKMAGIISNPTNNDISIRVKANSVILAQNSTPFNLTSHNNDVFDLEIDFTIRNTGGAGVASIMTLGKFYTVLKNGSNVQGTSFENLENTLFDTTIPNTLDIEVIWGQVDVGDSIYSRTFVLNKIY